MGRDDSRPHADSAYRELVETAPVPILVVAKATVTMANAAAHTLFASGPGTADIVGSRLVDLLVIDDPDGLAMLLDPGSHGISPVTASTTPTDSPDRRHLEVVSAPAPQLGRDAVEIVVHDITERMVLRQRLEQSNRLETVGRLAGGLAHNFNNLLQAILGQASALRAELEPDHPWRKGLSSIVRASRKGADLTRKLLTLSRSQPLEVKPVVAGELLHELEVLVRPLFSDAVRIHLDQGERCVVRADITQLQQALLNLVLNARDAMPDGGSLNIQVAPVKIAVQQPDGPPPGEWVAISVADTGIGMDEATMQRIFDPFFTSKGLAEGTGLGLSTVHAIIAEHGGHVSVRSEPGAGTTFTLHLPRVESADPEPLESGIYRLDELGLGNRLLLVEDDDEVREILNAGLRLLGYKVFQASQCRQALDILEETDVACVITDMVMPGMSGLDLVDELGQRDDWRTLPIILLTGFAPDADLNRLAPNRRVAVMTKPVSLEALHHKLQEMLGRRPLKPA